MNFSSDEGDAGSKGEYKSILYRIALQLFKVPLILSDLCWNHLDEKWKLDPKSLVWDDIGSTLLVVKHHDQYSNDEIGSNPNYQAVYDQTLPQQCWWDLVIIIQVMKFRYLQDD